MTTCVIPHFISHFENTHSIGTFIKNLFNRDILMILLAANALDSFENFTDLSRTIREKNGA